MTDPIVFFVFDDLNRITDVVALRQSNAIEPVRQCNSDKDRERRGKKFAAVFEVDGYFLSQFLKLLNVSEVYHRMVFENFINNFKHSHDDSEISVKFRLIKPKLEVMDPVWNDKISYLIAERQELEYAMSWLSTLGGAFSALGDCFENCAKVAGKISVQQFRIAFKLGEPLLVARCKLYMALSLIQLGKLAAAKNLIQEQYELAKNFKDFRLQNMCHGIWSKLQYVYKKKKLQKSLVL